MPIYEFYCSKCHTIYSFFSRRVETERSPACPKCKRKNLERQVSRFAFSTGKNDRDPQAEDAGGDDPFAGMDEEKMERAMAEMAGQMENMDENDPKAMAHVMRRLMDSTGMPMNSGMEEALRRMEAGEDPDKIDEEMGDVLDGDDLFAGHSKFQRLRKRLSAAPNVDPQVYDM